MLQPEWQKFFVSKLASTSTSKTRVKKPVKKDVVKKKDLDEIVSNLQNVYQNYESKSTQIKDSEEEDEEEKDEEAIEEEPEEEEKKENVFVSTFFNPNKQYLDLHDGNQILNFNILYDQFKKKKSKWENFITHFTHEEKESLSLLNILLLSNAYKVNGKLFSTFDECFNWKETNFSKYGAIQISLCNNKIKTTNSLIYYITFNLEKYLTSLKNCSNAFFQLVIYILFVLIRDLVSIVDIPIYIACNNYNLKLPFLSERKHYFIDYILTHAWLNCWQIGQLEQYKPIGGVKRK
jgi:ribosomal protein L12E/L44/L45/RPP1/RPP2